MDAKALAKSKRAHSQHHKNKPHPNQKSKAPSVSSDNAGSTPKPKGKQIGEKTLQVQRTSRLPSNWDRYEDEFDLDGEDQSGDSTNQASDVVVPKSKGADYSYLIAEAQSQDRSQSYSYSDSFPSLEDVMPEGFIEGVGSMLSVRGEGILSWIGEDNFIVDDKTTSVQEASFLSLNLNALAEQLAKVDLSQRLFVEAELLPTELVAEGSSMRIDDERSLIQTTHGIEAAADISEDVACNDLSEKVDVADTKFTLFNSRTYDKDATFHSQGPDLVNQVKDGLSSSHFDKSAQSRVLESTVKFEAAAAEEELDMLLDSFSDTKFLDSSGSKPNHNFTKSQQACSTAVAQPSRHTTASFVDVLDDLLQETSNLMNQSQDVKVVPHDAQSSSHSFTKSKPPEHSGKPVTTSFDDVLDDLLQESSNLMSQSQDVNVVTHDTQSSSRSATKSKVLDDFDSWLDTI